MDEEEDALALDPGFASRFEREARPPAQLYLVSPDTIGPEFAPHLADALGAGPVAAFQLRLKGKSDEQVLETASVLLPICREHDVAFILNDRMDLAQACGADGVHLGQADGDPAAARALLGPQAQIGRTCHDSRHFALEAGEAGCDYIAFGAFYPTQTHTTRYRPDPSILSWWATITGIPSVAIGGITPANARPLVEAGADFIAAVSAVWDHPDGPAEAIRQFNAVLRP